MAIRRIGQIFVDMGFISDEQLEMLLEEQNQRPGTLLGRIALELNLLNEEQVIQALAEQLGMQVVELGDTVIPHEVIDKMTESMAQLYRAVPIHFEGNRLTVATCDPQNITIQDELRSLLGHEIKIVIAGETDVRKTLEKYYDAEKETVDRIIDEIEDDPDLKKKMEAADSGKPLELADVEALADSAPVRKLLNMVLLLAIKDHASDIHFEPFEDEFRIRIKADGVLFEMVPPPRHLAFAITTRIKVMANLDIAERRLPQDGRIELNVGGNPVDLRVSVLPTMFGESVVIRVLDRTVVSLDLNKVGMTQEMIAERVGKDRTLIATTIRLLKLPDPVQRYISEGRMSAGHGRALLMTELPAVQRSVANSILEFGLSVRETEKAVKRLANAKLQTADNKGVNRQTDPNYKQAEDKLTRHLSTKVRLVGKGKKGAGKIEIEYYDASDLNRLYDLLMMVDIRKATPRDSPDRLQ
jgi:predicted regulator of amino acid metabolism with ACT domain